MWLGERTLTSGQRFTVWAFSVWLAGSFLLQNTGSDPENSVTGSTCNTRRIEFKVDRKRRSVFTKFGVQYGCRELCLKTCTCCVETTLNGRVQENQKIKNDTKRL
mmetsp:Transcript_68656/g.103521  ORF Transcript_68656/g.103521 Transcript_68656/m.103521 type:complete len:105 (+) Transcript_68656:233-547(+)